MGNFFTTVNLCSIKYHLHQIVFLFRNSNLRRIKFFCITIKMKQNLIFTAIGKDV